MPVRPEDHDTLARTIWGEARGESFNGQIAVAWVVLNRLAKGGYGTTIEEVCKKPWQFSCWNTSDPNRAKIENLVDEDHDFFRAKGIAALVMTKDFSDPTDGSTNYFADSIDPPSWSRQMVPTVTIGRHRFFRDET